MYSKLLNFLISVSAFPLVNGLFLTQLVDVLCNIRLPVYNSNGSQRVAKITVSNKAAIVSINAIMKRVHITTLAV